MRRLRGALVVIPGSAGACPQVLQAALIDMSSARSHVARALELHLVTVLSGIVAMAVSSILLDHPAAELAVVVLLVMATLIDVFCSLLRGRRWPAPWEPTVWGPGKFHHQQPFVGCWFRIPSLTFQRAKQLRAKSSRVQ